MRTISDRKGQTAGIVTGLIFGVAGLVIGVIIAFVIVQTLTGANLLSSSRPTVTNLNERPAFINTTGYTLAAANATTSTYAITGIRNATTNGLGFYNFTVLTPNASVSAAGLVTNATALVWHNVSLNYTYTSQTEQEMAANRLSVNFTSGVDNVSSKIPTVLLVAAIVLILGILAVLVGVWQRMRMGGGGTSV